MKITIIAAIDAQNLIGKQGQLPWHLPSDLQYFKKHTINKTLIMGQKTFASLPKLLPQRKHIVLSRNTAHFPPEVIHCASVSAALDYAKQRETPEVMIIGGASVYAAFLPRATHLRLTRIHHTFKGDTYFPNWDAAQFTVLSEEQWSDGPYTLTASYYQRKECEL